jgi:hypothetical protein
MKNIKHSLKESSSRFSVPEPGSKKPMLNPRLQSIMAGEKSVSISPKKARRGSNYLNKLNKIMTKRRASKMANIPGSPFRSSGRLKAGKRGKRMAKGSGFSKYVG